MLSLNAPCFMPSTNITYIKPSIEHEPINVPSWLKVTAVTGSEWAGSVFNVLPVFRLAHSPVLSKYHVPRATSHTRTDSSKLPDASNVDDGLKFTQKTKLVCPCRTFTTVNCSVERERYSQTPKPQLYSTHVLQAPQANSLVVRSRR